MDIAVSKAGVPVRLTDERWYHIVENHDDLAGYYDEVLILLKNRITSCAVMAAPLLPFVPWVEGNFWR